MSILCFPSHSHSRSHSRSHSHSSPCLQSSLLSILSFLSFPTPPPPPLSIILNSNALLHFSLFFALSSLILLPTVNSQSQPMPCQRWAQQTTISQANNSITLWIQGGEAKTSPDQSSNTWTNALLSLDLSKPWNAGSPALTLVQKDTGNPYNPPAVALGALWAAADGSKLYQWGGQFADNPAVLPGPMNVFEYDIAPATWKSLNTSGDSVLRASEGASALVPAIGSAGAPMAFYFGGHIDWSGVPGWSNSTPRVFLDSMVQLDLGSMVWTNYSTFTTSSSNAAFVNATVEGTPTIRADGTLTYVPSVGTAAKGVLVAIGGGQNFQSTTQNSNRSIDNSALDVFDLATHSWVKQATQGNIPTPRVNHCAVRGTAKVNGNPIHQVFVYGGQIVNGSAQSTEMYVLTIPGFTWTFIGANLSSQPSARAGHSCDLIGSQMIVIGGYVASDLLCDSQSVYIFDTTTLNWKNTYTPGLPYRTPEMLASMIGGTGVGHSTSGAGSALGGDGAGDPDVSMRYTGGGHKSSKGAIVGGVLGALVALLLVVLLWLLLKRKAKRKAAAEAAAQAHAQAQAREREKSIASNQRTMSGMYFDSDLGGGCSIGSEEMMGQGGFGMSGEKRMQFFPAASDDPEHDTEGYEPQFSTRLVPRQHLRVMNPEEDEDVNEGAQLQQQGGSGS